MLTKFRPFSAFVLLAACNLASAQQGPSSGVDLTAMNPAISACQNFYQYACGAWRTNHPVPADKARRSRFEELADRNQTIARDILEAAAKPSPKRTADEQKIGDYYGSCMDDAAIEAAGTKPIAPILARIQAMKTNKDVLAEIIRLHLDGARVFYGFSVRADAKNTNVQIAHIDQGGIGLPDRDFYLASDPRSIKTREQYEQNITQMFALLKGDHYTGKAPAVMAIETALAKASFDRVARRNPDNLYHKLTVAELQALTPDMDWKAYFAGLGLPPIDSLNVSVPDFIKAVDSLIVTSKLDDLKAYLAWHVLEANASLLPKAFRDTNFEFFGKALRGQQEQEPRWKQCVAATDRALGDALGKKFVEVAFNGASKTRALELVGEIEKAMRDDINNAAWMTPATKDQALTKLHQVSNKIGYPDKWKDYSTVKIVRGDYFGDATRAHEFERRRNWARLGKPVDKTEWGMTPPTVNAYYSPDQNNINFPAGILQPPFYSAKADDAVNYGAIGVVIGHELTHGFDDQGRRFDGTGNLRDWWTAEDNKNFVQRADCIVKEYEGFAAVPGANLNGKLTLGENAADNGGIHLAYAALTEALSKHMLPKLDGFTAQQRFFLGYAQIWCENATDAFWRLNAKTNPHSPGEFRVNGVVQNLREFADAFSCKVGDPMVSADACRVW